MKGHFYSRLFICLFVFLGTSMGAVGHAQWRGNVPGKFFDRVIFVLFENEDFENVMKQPFFLDLAQHSATFTNFSAITHPSQGNYISLTSGDLHGVIDDRVYDLNVFNIVDLLERAGVSWKVYAEDFPRACFSGAGSGNYVRKHNPFMSYLNIQKNPSRCVNIVNATEFYQDVTKGALPQYVFYIPNLKNDGHDTGVGFAGRWYSQAFGPLMINTSWMAGTVIATTFDEGKSSVKNQIYTTLYGPEIKVGLQASELNTFSLMALVEDNWNLGNLGLRDATAPRIPNEIFLRVH